MRDLIHLASVSGGKDSTATWLLCMKQFPSNTLAVTADTGNEHELTYEYLNYLEQVTGRKIERVKADFSDRFESKRRWVLEKWPEHGIPIERCERVAQLLQPSGNPFLDLCMLKGRFPSRMAQFCTTELKTLPLTEYAASLIDMLDVDIWSWQGVRRDESARRANALGFEDLTGGIFANRPIAGWTAQEVVDYVTKICGIKLNPLYALGFNRVGCMPCINEDKASLANLSLRYPEHIARIAEWEAIVKEVSKRLGASFFPTPSGDNRGALRGDNIVAYVQWSKTFRGGKVQNPVYDEPAPACASSYGLCE